MQSRVCVYTAICGGYDDLKPQPRQSIPCDFICFSDDPDRPAVEPWRVVRLRGYDGEQPRKRSKVPKILVHEAFASIGNTSGEYDVTIWIDGCIQILRENFVATFVDAVRSTGIAAVPHPDRDCIFEDAHASLGNATGHKYVRTSIVEQISRYRAAGYPEHNGIFAGGLIARDMRRPAIRSLNTAWWNEVETWSLQDQLALPYVLWKHGIRCEPVNVNLWRNPLFESWPHFDGSNDDLKRRRLPEYTAQPFEPPSGGDTIGTYDPKTGLWYLAGKAFTFGPVNSELLPITGDWRGDGQRLPGLYDPSTGTFVLRYAFASGPADAVFSFGPPGALPVVGDWNGTGRDSVGIYLPSEGYWALRTHRESGRADVEFHFGERGAHLIPVVGDWDGTGRDRAGLYEPTYSSWFLLSENATGARSRTLNFGPNDCLPLVGDWNADGTDEVGVFVPEQGQAFLARQNIDLSPARRTLVDPLGIVPVTASASSLR